MTSSVRIAIFLGACAIASAAQAAPVEYVRVCSTSGTGYFYIPGTDQCADARGLRDSVDLQRGLAASFALTAAPMPSAAGKTTWSFNVSGIKADTIGGNLSNKLGYGASLGHRIDLFNKPVMLTIGYANGGGNFHAGRLGIAGEF